MDDKIFSLWFHNLKIKNEIKINALKSGITPELFYKMDTKDYLKYNLNIIESEMIKQSKDLSIYKEIISYLKLEKINIVLFCDDEYPEILKNINSPPVGFFIKGKMPNLNNSLAIVGARKASDYGKTAAYKLSYDTALRGIVIISGMARGIDTSAHRGALDSNGKTIAVMGSGFKNIYPSENKKLMYEISENGCVITEYFPDIKPYSSNFPERNRLISGLSKYTMVVEAGERSGSLITAEFALEQGKDVFAVPGNIFSPNSIGTNRLIKDGAKIILSSQDILEEFKLENINHNNIIFDEMESKIIDSLKGNGSTIENLSEMLNIDAADLLSMLSKLECKGIIKRAYGNYYIKCIT
ncbi:DNA processing protein [Caloramator quimbayensis]|uniref:DNA processing protein n=1 Tax=Caloramator quimbayensis TaxID=1147123 RepID=A0A1T4XSR8_9CLOT|nr:DNA-processing protein DprA [Caloramator quimbayensis]SKA92125.1 DNA processing protein [Caloramator quimbayensis]